MAVFQQIVKDKIQGTPVAAITRAMGNTGRLVTFGNTAAQADRNKEALGAPVVELTNAAADIIKGVLGDYHHSKLVSICRKGRFYVAAATEFVASDIGKSIVPNGTDGKAEANDSADNRIGEILDGGEHENIGHYYYIDINLP